MPTRPKIAGIARRLVMLSGVLCALPIVVICRAISPWLRIRFGYFTADRIGHFAFDLEYYLSERYEREGHQQFLDWFFLKREPANHQLALMARRQLRINRFVEFLFRANALVPGGAKFEVIPSRETTASRDKDGVFYRTPVQLAFTDEENDRAKEYLEEVGCDDPRKIVCLVARDNAYLDSLRLERDWSYHSFRDTKIEDYRDVVQALVARGYWVFRMGKQVNDPLDIDHPQAIDYACSQERNDFLDVWLMANSFFSISTGLGLDSVSDIFRRPQVFVNYLPLMDMEAWGRYLTVPKILSWADTGRHLSLSEQIGHSSLNAYHYKEHGIEIRDLSQTEISDAVLEFEARLTGKWQPSEDEADLHERFWETMKAHPDFSKYHGWIHPDARAGTQYLKNTQKYLFA